MHAQIHRGAPAVAVLLAGLTLIAAGRPAPAQMEKMDVKGKVTKFNPANEAQKAQGLLAVILVEGKKTPTTENDKASVKVTDKTKIWKQVGDKKQPATVADLKQGAEVSVRFTGPVLESYPVQATAGELIIHAPQA